jgi:hypothetical protein
LRSIDTNRSFFHNYVVVIDESQPDVQQTGLSDNSSSPDSRFTRSHLESLSTDELIKLADTSGLDIPAGLERIFIIEELLELTHGGEFMPQDDLENRPDFIEAATLPKQYNISFIEALIRDPLWAFVFWEVKSHDREIHEKAPDFGGYCLRVIPLFEDAEPRVRILPVNLEHSFTVPVGVNDTAWYLGFPPAERVSLAESRRYVVRLCALRGEQEMVLSVSRPFVLPRLPETVNRKTGAPKENAYQNPLACLSGAGDFSVIRSTNRQSRPVGNPAPGSIDCLPVDQRPLDRRSGQQPVNQGLDA